MNAIKVNDATIEKEDPDSAQSVQHQKPLAMGSHHFSVFK